MINNFAAIGAGGVLRDITHTHGALHPTELHRFTNPAEAAASLALREGEPRSLEFYLDHGTRPRRRPGQNHRGCLPRVGFRPGRWGWTRSCSPPPETSSPTSTEEHAPVVSGAPRLDPRCATDGNNASVGDVIITRTNDRRLRMRTAIAGPSPTSAEKVL